VPGVRSRLVLLVGPGRIRLAPPRRPDPRFRARNPRVIDPPRKEPEVSELVYTGQQIARICHEANRALQCVNGEDEPSPAWADAPEWQRESAAEGVASALAGESAEELHESWCQHKITDGWRYGEVKDGTAKTHPCLVPYAELPEGQRRKDALFHAIVGALSR
jgi:RyR domain